MREPAAAVRAPPRRSPYLGLVPYSEDDAAYFFGRDRIRQRIIANLKASRLTLLWGESGVGKTSVLQAGVVRTLRQQAAEEIAEGGIPEFVVVEFASWRDEPIAALAEAIARSAERLNGGPIPDAPAPSRRLDELIESWAQRLGADLLIIFDQFEEYFLYHAEDDGEGTFGVEFPRAVNRPDLRANFLVAIREDGLAKLDRFKGRIPHLFGNYLRIEHLDREAARQAIIGPIERLNATPGEGEPTIDIEPALVEQVLTEVQTGQLTVGQAGEGVVTTSSSDGPTRVETPYLQLVMSRLWDEERAAGSTTLRLATLERLGGAERIVRTHLDTAMAALPRDERDVAARIFRFLVSAGGTKIAHTAADLAAYAELSEAQTASTLERLAGGEARILRAVAPAPGEIASRYEIFHDVLAPAVLDWRARHDEQRRIADQQRAAETRVRATRRRARLAVGGVAIGSAVVIAAALAVIFVNERDEARAQALAANATALLEVDPQQSLALAVEALGIRETSMEALDAARRAMSHSRVRGLVDVHSDIVWSAAFSPDGSRVVTASDDGTAAVCLADSGRDCVVLAGHTEAVTSASFTPDGERVVTGSEDGTAAVWDVSSSERLLLLDHGAPVYLTASDMITSDGSYLATGAFSADGARVVTTAGTTAWVWDLGTGELIAQMDHAEFATTIFSAAFSPDGSSVVTGPDDATGENDAVARIWDVESGEVFLELHNFTAYIRQAIFSPDGAYVACANSDGSVGVFDAVSGAVIEYPSYHTDEVKTVAFSPDSTRLVSAGDKTAVVHEMGSEPETVIGEDGTEVETGEVLPAVEFLAIARPHASWIDSARFSPDGNHIVTAHQDGTARVADSRTGEELVAMRGHTSVVWTAAFGPDGNSVVTSSEDGTARIWDVGVGMELRGHTGSVYGVSFSPDGQRVATASLDQTASTWDAMTGEELTTLFGDEAEFGLFPMNSSHFSSDGGLLITAQGSGSVAVWDLSASDPQPASCCINGWPAQWAVFLGGDPGRAIVGYEDSSVRIWDLVDDAAGREVHAITEGQPIAFAVSPDAQTIVTVGREDKMARAWSTESLEEVGSWHIGLVPALDFHPSEPLVVTAGLDGVISVWEVPSGRAQQTLPGNGGVIAVAFSTDGDRIVAGYLDGSTRVFDAESGQLLGLLTMHTDTINAIDVAQDGRIVTGSDDGTAKIYECEVCLPPDQLIEAARRQLAVTERAEPTPAASP